MPYYTGTYKECQAYDERVSQAESYPNKGDNWDTPIESHTTPGRYAILKHPAYTSSMQCFDELPHEFLPQNE